MDTNVIPRLDPVKVSACIGYKEYTKSLRFTKTRS